MWVPSQTLGGMTGRFSTPAGGGTGHLETVSNCSVMDASSDLDLQSQRKEVLTRSSNGPIVMSSRCIHKREEEQEMAEKELVTMPEVGFSN